jgi:hypothetical protein
MANKLRGCPRRAVYMLLAEDVVADIEKQARIEHRSRNNFIEATLVEKLYGKPNKREERIAA